jgi:hypothetical protein
MKVEKHQLVKIYPQMHALSGQYKKESFFPIVKEVESLLEPKNLDLIIKPETQPQSVAKANGKENNNNRGIMDNHV